MTEPDPKKQSIIKAPSRAVAKARSNMASRALASVHKTTITNSIGMKLKLIPAGEFLMGSLESDPQRDELEMIQHRVRITKPFYMQTTTVTQSQWMAVVGTEPWAGEKDRYVKKGSDYPAVCVSHNDVVDFCRQLSELENSAYCLPTEAQWEYACRAGSTTAYCFGDSPEKLNRYAWFTDYEAPHWYQYEKELHLHPVAQKRPNGFGLYDMHGNVWEWCSDWYDESRVGGTVDPTGPSWGFFRVVRGGRWHGEFMDCRSAACGIGDPTQPSFTTGFRVSLSPSGK